MEILWIQTRLPESKCKPIQFHFCKYTNFTLPRLLSFYNFKNCCRLFLWITKLNHPLKILYFATRKIMPVASLFSKCPRIFVNQGKKEHNSSFNLYLHAHFIEWEQELIHTNDDDLFVYSFSHSSLFYQFFPPQLSSNKQITRLGFILKPWHYLAQIVQKWVIKPCIHKSYSWSNKSKFCPKYLS